MLLEHYLTVHQHCSWSVTCWLLTLLGCQQCQCSLNMLVNDCGTVPRVGKQCWYCVTGWQTVLVLCHGLANSVGIRLRGLRKQTTFHDATNGFLAKWRLRDKCGNSILMTTQIWEVLLIGWGKFSNTVYWLWWRIFVACYWISFYSY